MKRTAHLHIYFNDMDVVDPDDAIETIRATLYDLKHKCEQELAIALEDIGAKNVEVGITVY